MRNQFPVVAEWHKGAKTAGVGNISGKFVSRSVTAEGDGHSSTFLSPCFEALAPVSNSELENSVPGGHGGGVRTGVVNP